MPEEQPLDQWLLEIAKALARGQFLPLGKPCVEDAVHDDVGHRAMVGCTPLPCVVNTVRGVNVRRRRGSLTGLVGVGGGFLIVPALVWGGLPMRDAVGTSLLVIAMNCVMGFYGYVGQVKIAWLSVALVTAGTMPGIATGTYAMRFVSQQALRRGFAVLLFGVAVYMLYRNLGA